MQPCAGRHEKKHKTSFIDAMIERNSEKNRQMILKHLDRIKQTLDAGELEPDSGETD